MLLRRKPEISEAQRIVLAASAKARVELLIGEMGHNLWELRSILVEGQEPRDRPDRRRT